MTYCSIQELGFFATLKSENLSLIKSLKVNTFVILVLLLALTIKPVFPQSKKSSHHARFLKFGKCFVFQFKIHKYQYYKNMLGILLSASASLLILKNWAQFFYKWNGHDGLRCSSMAGTDLFLHPLSCVVFYYLYISLLFTSMQF